MSNRNNTLYPLAAFCLIATGFAAAPASADMDVVAVLATQTRLADDTRIFELGVDRNALIADYRLELSAQLEDRLLDEFETSKRSALLASDFSEQILRSLDKRLPLEVDNLISALN